MTLASITRRSAIDREQLQQAFAIFSQVSEQLSGAYRDLQDEVHRLTQELAAANAELQRTQRLSAMGEMAARLAHQLRTPLATALLYTVHLARPGLGDAVRLDFAGKVLSRLRHLDHLIGDMLLFARGETGEAEVVTAADLLAELRQIMEPQMTQRGLQFSIVDRSGGGTVVADRKALHGALVSLLENAMQASPRGSTVSLECIAGDKTLAFRVHDEGSGIPPDVQARMFEPFFTTREEGTGLGLAIVHTVAQSLGGTIEVVSAPGAGAEFVMRVPCRMPADQRSPKPEPAAESEMS